MKTYFTYINIYINDYKKIEKNYIKIKTIIQISKNIK